MVNQLPVGSTYTHRAYLFYAVDVDNASGTLLVPGSAAETYTMPWAGSVTGVVFKGSGTVGGTLTTGTLQPLVMVAGAALTPFSGNPKIMVSQAGGYFNQDAQATGYRFAQGATLGAVYDKTGTVAPTGAMDLTVEVWVLHEQVQY